MPILHNSIIPAAADSTPADPVTRSLRFDANRSDSSLHRTFSSGSQTNWTFSVWYKRTETGSTDYIFNTGSPWGGYSGGTNNSSNQKVTNILIRDTNKLRIYAYNGSVETNVETDMLFRDPSAWYHIFVSWDSSQSSGSRYKIFVNGEEVSCTHTADSTNFINRDQTHGLGFYSGNANSSHLGSRWPYMAGYLADCYFIDGITLSTPVDNMIESTGYGSYKPKAFDMSSYGGNSFHLDMQPSHDADLLVSSVARNDGDTDFADAAAGHTLTTGGDPEHSIAVGNPFTGDDRAIYFDGSSDYLTSTDAKDDANFDNSDWTLEFWINPSNTFGSAIETFMGCGGGTAGWNSTNGHSWTIFAYDYTNQIYFQWWNGSSNVNMAANDDLLPKNTWTHVAVVNQSGTKRFYIGGVQVDTDSNTKAAVSTPSTFNIGVSSALDAKFNGHLYDVSIQRGYCKYEDGTTFTPPTSKITADSNTEFLLQPEKDDSSFEDESSNGHTVSTQGSPTTIASTPYEAAAKSTAMYFDGVNDYVETTGSSDFAFGTGDFTIEGWYYFLNIPSNNDLILVDTRPNNDGTTTAFSFSTDTTNGVKIYSGSSYALGGSLSTNTWHHIALVRDSGTLYAYIDGVPTGTTQTYTNNLTTNGTPRLGATAGGTHARLNGYVFDVRIIKGTARYTSSFTAPSAPFELNPVYIGADQSGNKNHFTPTNISSHDVMRDTPTSNFCTFSPISGPPRATTTISEGNLKVVGGFSTYFMRVMGTVAVSSGKWFYEVRCGSNHTNSREYGFKGINTSWPTGSHGLAGGSNSTTWANESEMAFSAYHSGVKFGNSVSPATSGTSWGSDGDVIGLALDLDSSPRTLRVFKNGSEVGSATNIPTGGSTEWVPCIDETSYGPQTSVANFGQDPTFGGLESGTTYTSDNTTGVVGEFHNPIPSGYLPFAAGNLGDPTVTPEENFDAVVYGGNSQTAAQRVSTSLSQADLVWIKARGNNNNHVLMDSIRGTEKHLSSDSSAEEGTWSTVTNFAANSSGTYEVGTSATVNGTGSHIAWNWKAHEGGPVTRSHTLTLEVDDLYGSGSDWYNTKLEVWEGATKLKDITQPAYTDGSSTTWTIKTNNTNKIKVVWDVDSSMDWYAMYAVLKDSSNTTLASWDGNNYDGYSSTPADGSNFYIPSSGYDSSNAAVTGVVESSSPTVESYNSAAGFTMIKYAGDGYTDGDTQTLDHSLGVPLEFVMAKARTSNDGQDNGDWIVWHKDLASSKYLFLNENYAQRTETSGYDLIATATSGTQHQVVVNNGTDNSSFSYHYLNSGPDVGTGEDYILYGWAGVEGYSKFGKYEGNNSPDGPFIHFGFRPKFFMYKQSTGSTNWVIVDAERETHNTVDLGLFPNLTTNEQAGSSSNYKMDFLSNGVKIRTSASGTNANNQTFIYAAFAESPFKHANAR